MRIFILFAFACFSMSSLAQTKIDSSDVRLRVGQSIVGCTFDRSKSVGLRSGVSTISGRFSVNCGDDALPYRLVTSLSPIATLFMNDERRMRLTWYVKKDSPACIADEKAVGAVEFHSGSRQGALQGGTGVTNWFYCLKITPRKGEPLKEFEYWPVNGELELALEDAKHGVWLPESASVITITFDHNSSTLSEQGKMLLNNVLMNIGGPKNVDIQIHAHASSEGDQQYNHDLSIMRLKSVRDWLMIEGGVSQKSTWGQAWGEDRPFAVHTIEDEAPQNRRVDVVFMPKEQSTVPVVEVVPAPAILKP